MDFEFRYTPEQEAFRKEVRAWLDMHVPMDFEISDNPHDVLPGSAKYEFIVSARRKLGQKGWLAPTWPREHGGGGLGLDEAIVIEEEVARRPWSRFGIGDFFTGTLNIFAPMLYVLGTEEQKQRFLPPMLRGEVIAWQGYSEPDCGSDIASVKTTAIRDGDDYIVNGSKLWLGSQFNNADYIYVVAVTDPAGHRHRNFGLFLVPTDLPGISLVRTPMMRNCHSGGWQAFFDNVRVSVEYLLGGHENATNAWQGMRETAIHVRNRPVGAPARDHNQEFVLAYCRETKRNGRPLSQDPAVREALVEVEIQLEISRLFALRQNWMVITGKRLVGYEAAQLALHGKATNAVQADAYNDILGPAVFMKDPELELFQGNIEYQQFLPIAHASAGMTQELNKVLMARTACRAGD